MDAHDDRGFGVGSSAWKVDKQQDYGNLHSGSCIDTISSPATSRRPKHCVAWCDVVPNSVRQSLLVVSMWFA